MTFIGVEKALTLSTTRAYTGIMRVPGATPGTRPFPVLIASLRTSPGYADAVTSAIENDLGLPVLRALSAAAAHQKNRWVSLLPGPDVWTLLKTSPTADPVTVLRVPVPSERWQMSALAYASTAMLFIGRDRDLPDAATGSGQLYPWLHYRVSRGHFHYARIPCASPS